MNNEHQQYIGSRNSNNHHNSNSNISSSITSSSSASFTTSTTPSSAAKICNFYIAQQQATPNGGSGDSVASAIVAAIIPDTPIVSIAGATQLSDITTTTTSTTTTPTPTATPTTYVPSSTPSVGEGGGKQHKNANNNKASSSNGDTTTDSAATNNRNRAKKTIPMSDIQAVDEVAAEATTTNTDTEINDNNNTTNPLEEAPLNATTNTTTNNNENDSNTTTSETQNATLELNATKTTTSTLHDKLDETVVTNHVEAPKEANGNNSATIKPAATTTTTNELACKDVAQSSNNASSDNTPTTSLGGAAASTSANNEAKSKEFAKPVGPKFSDMPEDDLRRLLDEAISYKNPRDKENKSETFLHLLKQAQNEEQLSSFPRITCRHTPNSTSSSTSSSAGGHSHHHHSHNHHHHKQGGSLENLKVDHHHNSSGGAGGEAGGVGGGPGGSQKKFSSVSSRQREGGSLPSMFERRATTASGSTSGKQQRRNAKATAAASKSDSEKENAPNGPTAAASAATATLSTGGSNSISASFVGSSIPVITSGQTAYIEDSDRELIVAVTLGNTNGTHDTTYNGGGGGDYADSIMEVGALTGRLGGTSANSNVTTCPTTGDCVIDFNDELTEIQQKQQILQNKPNDPIIQGIPYYECAGGDLRTTRSLTRALPMKTDFAPTTAQSYVDESPVFDRGAFALTCNATASNCDSAEQAMGAAPTSARVGPSVVVTPENSYMPLDENYRSCKSVLGRKNVVPMPGPPTSSVFSNTKTRQYDENANALGDGLQKTVQSLYMGLNAIPTTTGSDSFATLANSATNNTAAAAAAAATSASVSSQVKTKQKKKTQEERNTKTVCLESVAGYRGHESIEELLKYIENTDDKQAPGGGSKFDNSKFDKKKKKQQQDKKDEKQHQPQKMKKSNSLEELSSCSKIIVDDDLKRKAATTESSNVMMRPQTQTAKGGKKNNNASNPSVADIHKNFEGGGASGGGKNAAGRKKERRSWGTEELQYLGDANASDEKQQKERKPKSNTNNKEKEELSNSLLALGRENRFGGEKQSNVVVIGENDKLTATGIIAVPLLTSGGEKIAEKVEKRKKSDGPVIIAHNSKGGSGITVDPSIIDFGKETERLITSEPGEFHVVTKKKKAKKKSAFTAGSVAFTQGVGLAPGAGGDETRVLGMNNSNKANNVTLVGQSRYNKYNNLYGDQQQHHQQQPQQQQNAPSATNKSRRKSTSSMPPSEKSDSSDVDSVHSLPIEKTTSTNASATRKKKKQKQKVAKASSSATGGGKKTATGASATTTAPIPISYADIARINREKAAAAAMALEKSSKEATPSPSSDASLLEVSNAAAAATVQPATVEPHLPASQPQQQVTVEDDPSAGSVIPGVNCITTYPTLATKVKGKRSASKPDFPELVASNNGCWASNDTPISALAPVEKAKGGITYSQSLSNPVAIVATSSVATAPVVEATPAADAIPIDHKKQEKRKSSQPEPVICATLVKSPEANRKLNPIETESPSSPATAVCNNIEANVTPTLSATAASVTTPSYTFMDQQYPALGKTLKRSAATASANSVGAVSGTATQFNFAAAAKQQIPNDASSGATCHTPTTSNTCGSKKAKEKSPTMSAGVLSFSEAVTINATKKNQKKDNKPQQPAEHAASVDTAETTLNEQPPPARSWSEMTEEDEDIGMHSTESIEEPQKSTAYTQTSSATTKMPSGSSSAAEAASATNATSTSVTPSPPTKPTRATVSAATSTTSLVAAAAAASASLPGNRPAVIILDDRSPSSETDITFGDFIAGEITFLDDENTDDDTDVGMSAEADDSEESMKPFAAQTVLSAAQTESATSTAQPVAPHSFNDSGLSNDRSTMARDNSSGDDMIIVVAAKDASSPNTSYGHSQMGAVNQSGDSGIYTNHPKGAGMRRLSPPPEASSDNEQVEEEDLRPLPPQQLETCNEIETAIIAAARRAAASGEQYPQHPIVAAASGGAARHQHMPATQTQAYHRGAAPPSHTYTNSSSFSNTSSSSSTVSMDKYAAYPAPMQSPPLQATALIMPHPAHLHRQTGPPPPQGPYYATYQPHYQYNAIPHDYFGPPIILSSEEMPTAYATAGPGLPAATPIAASSFGRAPRNNNRYIYINHPPPPITHHPHHHVQHHHHTAPYLPPNTHSVAMEEVSDDPSYEETSPETPTPTSLEPEEPESPPLILDDSTTLTERHNTAENVMKEICIQFREPSVVYSDDNIGYLVKHIADDWEKIARNKNIRVYSDDNASVRF